MQRSTSPEETVQFAGLTTHNNVDMSQRAETIAGMDSDDLPDTSFATAIRELETADVTTGMWELPDSAASAMDVDEFNDEAPDGTEAVELKGGGVAIKTERYEPLYSPDKVREWTQGDYTGDDDAFRDALWHYPTKDYNIINPLTAYEPLETAVRDEDLGDSMFGTIRQYRGGGRVHMDIMFDAYSIDTYNDDDDEPIVLGIRTGYDFFGGTALYFEGFAQDRRCKNSIRSLTEKKTIRHVGDDTDLEEEVEDVLEQLGVMQDKLAELIEMAEDIELEILDLELAEPFDHDDHLRAFYELAGFPSYLAQSAANHARSRADNVFMPDMTEVWDGATYALTHDFRGGEDTARARELVQTASDMVQNPSQVISQVERSHRTRMTTTTDDGDIELQNEDAHASIQEFSQSVKEKADDFESTQDELRQTLVAEAPGGDDVATDGGQ